VAAGAVAGAAGSAGAIASLVSYPALLEVGIGPLAANVTNAVAGVTIGIGSTLSSREELRDQWRRLRRWAPLCVAGGSAGAVLLLVTPSAVFDWVVPVAGRRGGAGADRAAAPDQMAPGAAAPAS
jgi:uncharacterized protein